MNLFMISITAYNPCTSASYLGLTCGNFMRKHMYHCNPHVLQWVKTELKDCSMKVLTVVDTCTSLILILKDWFFSLLPVHKTFFVCDNPTYLSLVFFSQKETTTALQNSVISEAVVDTLHIVNDSVLKVAEKTKTKRPSKKDIVPGRPIKPKDLLGDKSSGTCSTTVSPTQDAQINDERRPAPIFNVCT